jgi:prepilin-type processing-associated H-X9-DG protein
MARFTVTTPEPAHNGKLGNVTFVDGQAVIDEDIYPAELAYCRAQGYGIADEAAAQETSDDELRARLEQLGVKPDPRWKTKRLQAELEKASARQPDEEPGNDEETTS